MQVRALPPQATGAVPRRRAGAAILRGAAAQRLGRGAGGLGRAVLEAAVALRHAREVLVAEGLASAAEGGDHHLRVLDALAKEVQLGEEALDVGLPRRQLDDHRAALLLHGLQPPARLLQLLL